MRLIKYCNIFKWFNKIKIISVDLSQIILVTWWHSIKLFDSIGFKCKINYVNIYASIGWQLPYIVNYKTILILNIWNCSMMNINILIFCSKIMNLNYNYFNSIEIIIIKRIPKNFARITLCLLELDKNSVAVLTELNVALLNET